MVGCLHRLSGHESEQTPGDTEGQMGCGPGGRNKLDRTQQLNNNKTLTLEILFSRLLKQIGSKFCLNFLSNDIVELKKKKKTLGNFVVPFSL